MRKKCILGTLSGILAFSLLFSACTSTSETSSSTTSTTSSSTTVVTTTTTVPTSTTEEPQYGGSFNYVAASAPKTFENLVAYSAGWERIGLFYSERLAIGDWAKGPGGTGEWDFSLTQWVPLEHMKGGLAESWEQTDPLTYIFHIRQGVHFQDIPPVNGRELEAEDIKYNFERWKGSGVVTKDYLMKIASIEVLDKYTVKFTATEVNSELLWQWIAGPSNEILAPEMVIAGSGSLEDWHLACGTGPFMVDDFIVDSSITFKRNPNYWDYDELHPGNKLPYVDKVNYIIIPEDNSQLAAVRTGQCDLYMGVDPDAFSSLIDSAPKLNFRKYLETGSLGFTLSMTKEPFNDIRVRKALSMSVDRDMIVAQYYGGEAVPLNWPMMANWYGLFTPIEELPDEFREAYEYHPDRAIQLLKDAGHPTGFNMEIWMRSYGAAELEMVEIVVDQWAAIGVNANINLMDYTTWTGKILKDPKSWTGAAVFRGGTVSPYRSLVYGTTGSYWNYAPFEDPVYDKMVADIFLEGDVNKQNEMVREASLYYLSKVFTIRFPAPYLRVVWWPWVKNYNGEIAIGQLDTAGMIARCWIDSDTKKSLGY